MANLNLSRAFNTRDYAIGFVFDDNRMDIPIEQRRYIKLVDEKVLMENSAEQEDWIENVAPQEWIKKYGELPEYADFDFFEDIYWAEITSARAIPYDGTMIFTTEEQQAVADETFAFLQEGEPMQEQDVAPSYIPISQLNAYAYCPRRFYYEFTLAEMVVNEHVLEGQQLHGRVDQLGSSTHGEKLQLRHLYLCAPKLGLIGYCDLVEIEGGTTDLATATAGQKIYPVEYKKGKMGKWLSDHTQLCAQALALEEVLNAPWRCVAHGYMFSSGSERRDEVVIDAALRSQTLAILDEARQVALLKQPPAPITNWRKCRDCSLEPICLPREVLKIVRIRLYLCIHTSK